MGAHFAFSGDPEALLELDGKEAIGALHELAPVVTKTMQVCRAQPSLFEAGWLALRACLH